MRRTAILTAVATGSCLLALTLGGASASGATTPIAKQPASTTAPMTASVISSILASSGTTDSVLLAKRREVDDACL